SFARGSGANLVHSTTLSDLGSPEATPNWNGSLLKNGSSESIKSRSAGISPLLTNEAKGTPAFESLTFIIHSPSIKIFKMARILLRVLFSCRFKIYSVIYLLKIFWEVFLLTVPSPKMPGHLYL